ncbi:MAG TPA: STAS/SEC14 domain-containing protein [Chthoniobacterales bacterium]|nr:STAS/SEC14 domain-containing protein [Chthoniobacterales bacterium]
MNSTQGKGRLQADERVNNKSAHHRSSPVVDTVLHQLLTWRDFSPNRSCSLFQSPRVLYLNIQNSLRKYLKLGELEKGVMPIQFEDDSSGKVVVVRVSGRLTLDEYKQFVPEFDRSVERKGKIRLLFEISQLHSWEAGAAWEDIKLGFKHFADIERLAMVGEKKWQEVMSWVCRPFTTAEVRYFDHGDILAARKWLESD